MLKIIVFLSVISFSLAGESCSKELCDCGVAGEWENQLGSKVTLECKDGQLEGKYNSAVGQAEDYYLLSGRYTLGEDNAVLLGWVVAWNNKKFGNSMSATSWSGIYYPEEGKIRTQWILTSYKKSEDYWETSLTNNDEFVRIK